jgi:hypothetical protein
VGVSVGINVVSEDVLLEVGNDVVTHPVGGSVGVHSSTIRCCVQMRNSKSTSINCERAGSHTRRI